MTFYCSKNEFEVRAGRESHRVLRHLRGRLLRCRRIAAIWILRHESTFIGAVEWLRDRTVFIGRWVGGTCRRRKGSKEVLETVMSNAQSIKSSVMTFCSDYMWFVVS